MHESQASTSIQSNNATKVKMSDEAKTSDKSSSRNVNPDSHEEFYFESVEKNVKNKVSKSAIVNETGQKNEKQSFRNLQDSIQKSKKKLSTVNKINSKQVMKNLSTSFERVEHVSKRTRNQSKCSEQLGKRRSPRFSKGVLNDNHGSKRERYLGVC